MPETTTASRKPRRGEQVKTTTGGARRLACDANGPQVSIIMGSDSDWPTMEPAAQVLTDFNVGFEADVVSAHRMPEDMIEFGRGAHKRGIKVIIAGAGGAAHLPGMVAALTPLPVIGVPVPLAHLDGMDSLLSIVQMPRGVPVATFAIGEAGAVNAALFAVALLATTDPALAARLESFRREQEAAVEAVRLPPAS